MKSDLRDLQFERIIAEVEDYAILLLDKDGTITTWNKAAEKIAGYSADEIIGENYKVFYSKEDRDAHLPDTLLELATKKGKIAHEGWRVRKDGSKFWGSVTITVIYDDDKKITGYLKVTRDLTERKVAEDNILNYAEYLKVKNEALRKSEERYHKMVSEVRDYAIILLDTDGTILDWNKGAEHLKGYSANEILGKNFRIFYPKEHIDSKLPEQLLQEAVKNGSVTREGWRIRKDGNRFWGYVAITALHNDNGQIIGFSKVTRDLTEKKIAEDQLSNLAEDLRQKNEILTQSEERYHRMIAEVRDYAIILLNRNGNIESWNAGAENIKGYAADEIIGKNFSVFYSAEDRQNKLPERLLDQAVRTGKAIHEGWRVKKSGGQFWGSIVITALHDTQGEVIGFSKVTRDLTEKKKAEDTLKANAVELELKNQTLERLNAELLSFTYVASHDLKEPLRKIQTFATQLKEGEDLGDSSKDYLERIKKSAVQMQKLIEDLLAYSRVSKDASKFEKVDLNEILQEVKDDLEIVIKEKRAVIESTLLPSVYGVRFQFHQLFLNLLSNSLKFSKKNEPPMIRISCGVVENSDIPGAVVTGISKYYQISVSDTGIGFEPEASTKIFDPFQRLHTKKHFAGHGIGLSIVKQVVENHHGIVVAEGQLNVGATLHIYLPFIEASEGSTNNNDKMMHSPVAES